MSLMTSSGHGLIADLHTLFTDSMTTSNIKEKIAKLLRMQESSNANEAANAAAFVERLCREHGVSAHECMDHDLEEDVAVDFFYGKASGRLDPSMTILLMGVANYFNGYLVRKSVGNRQKILHIFAPKANQIQIELYTDYLIEVRDRLAREHCPVGSVAYRNNFKKGFAYEIHARLQQMAAERRDNGIAELGMPGLAVVQRDKKQDALSLALRNSTYSRLRSSGAYSTGAGADAGRSAAKSVGLNKQVRTSSRRMLAGA